MLTTNQQTINLGRIQLGQPTRFFFTLANSGPKSTSISNITVGCGSCTQASTQKSVIEPQGTTQIDVVFTPNSTGVNMKSVYVHHNTGKLQLKFTAEVYG